MTRALDITSKEVFEDALLAFPGTEIIVSHDRYLIDKVSTRVIEIGEKDASSEKEKKTSSDEKEIGFGGFAKGSEEERQAKKRAETERRRNERKLAEAEAKVSELESRKKELEEELCLPEVFSDQEKAQNLSLELEDVKSMLDEAYMDWLELQGE